MNGTAAEAAKVISKVKIRLPEATAVCIVMQYLRCRLRASYSWPYL